MYLIIVSLLPTSKKIGNTKTQIVTKPKPKLQGLKAFEALPKKGKKAKTKKTTLIQTTLKLDQQKVLSKATHTSQSMSSGQSTEPQHIEGNIQPVVKGLPSTADEDIRTSSHLSEAKPIDPKDSKGNIHPADKGLPAIYLDKGTSIKDHVDKTQSTRFEVSDTNHNKDSEDDLKDLSDEEMYEAGEEIDDETQALVEEYLEENEEHRHQTDKEVDSVMEYV
nr:hypothetical protein [Tanacetum cinerariifolium]